MKQWHVRYVLSEVESGSTVVGKVELQVNAASVEAAVRKTDAVMRRYLKDSKASWWSFTEAFEDVTAAAR